MTRKTTQQQLDDRLTELRGLKGIKQGELDDLQQYYNENVGNLEGNELENISDKISHHKFLVREFDDKIDDLKKDKAELDIEKAEANSYKWKEIEPLLLKAIEKYHISYNVEANKFVYCMDMSDGKGDIMNPTFRTFDGSRVSSAVSKMIGRYIFDANINIQKAFITKNKTHYQETASFLYTKWDDSKVYNKAKIISTFWLEPVFGQAYNPDFDLLMYCIGGGKQENIDHLEQWPVYKYMYPERVANTPNLDCGGKPGGNGKGRYGELGRTIFTPNCIVPAAAKELNDGFNASWELATILLFDEPSEKELPAGKMKQATGGEEQRVERKGVDAYTADRNYSMLALSNNSYGVFKLSGTGTGGEDRRFSVMNTNIVMIDEIMARENCSKDQAGVRANEIAQLVKNRTEVAKWMGAMILKHGIAQMPILKPLHGADYRQRFEDQKSTLDNIFDQLLPVFEQCEVISVKIIQDIVGILTESKTAPNAKTMKKHWKDYLSRNKIAVKEAAQQHIDVVMTANGSTHVVGTHQSYAFRIDSATGAVTKQFDWGLVADAVPSKDFKKEDMKFQL
jgi:hypothetical protein